MRPLEFAGWIYMIGSGLWFLNPSVDTFSTSATNPYHFLAELMPEPVFAMILIGLGFANMYAFMRDNCWLQKSITIITLFFWLFVANMFMHANSSAWLFFNAVFLAVVHVWVYLRTSRRCRVRMEVRETLRNLKDNPRSL